MRSGNLLVECSNKSQSTNLLTMKTITNFPVSASPHNSLNSCKGIIRDRSQYLGDLTVEEIGEELSSQGVTDVVRFQIKKNGNIIKLNTYLLTFRTPTPPPSITLGCFGIRVDMFIPNPIRCFTCQKFGHGSKQCRGTQRCFKCSDEGHEGTNCNSESSKCVNFELTIITKNNEKKKSNEKETVKSDSWGGESIWDLPSDIDDSSTLNSLPSSASKKISSSSSTKSTRAPSPLRSLEKKDVQKKPVNTSSQMSSDSRSRGRGRGGVKPAACGPGDRRLSSHNRFSTLIDETEMEIESVPPPERSQSQDKAKLKNLTDQLPSPFILMGDFNAHNPLWGSKTHNAKGKIIEDFVSQEGLCIFNDGSNTYLHPGNGSYSSIDITICDPSRLLDYSWRVHDDLCGSDHFHIVLEHLFNFCPTESTTLETLQGGLVLL
ncbi:Hypothetical predicted protein [Mytilus galloprovincialis]|uniref:CCHC-type domain-containing protein n=1 Tax=Mytilus galloprovincialis TaxID=29158 RepID=A0A8B6DUG4_MYTGA|nr:Hypothetical predicted protein [Mytilus galloprovincialis]